MCEIKKPTKTEVKTLMAKALKNGLSTDLQYPQPMLYLVCHAMDYAKQVYIESKVKGTKHEERLSKFKNKSEKEFLEHAVGFITQDAKLELDKLIAHDFKS